MEVEAAKTAKPYRKVAITKVVPNDWNPNIMEPKLFRKLINGLKRTIAQSGDIPPIVVRRGKEKNYEIIDGYHRWKALQELGESRIPVFILDVDDSTARVLTNTLNYLRGEPDLDIYAQNITDILSMSGGNLKELAEYLPESAVELETLIDEASVVLTPYEQLVPEDEALTTDLSGEEDVWVDLKFRVSLPVAKVIEAEIQRISTKMRGKHIRSRCLEMMAAQSASTPLPHDL